MNRLLGIASAAALLASPALADTWVNGHYTSNGTYVQGHYRTEPNSTRNDNYSTRGNVNPYTGQPGTRPRDEDTTSSYGSTSRRSTTSTYGRTTSSYGNTNPWGSSSSSSSSSRTRSSTWGSGF